MAQSSKSTDMRGMWIALAGYIVLFAGKLAAYFITHLGVMFAEAMHSMADILIASFLLLAAWVSSKPADEEFRFGYGRAQNIAALVAATIFISFTSFETLRESVPKLFQPAEGPHQGIGLAIGVILVSLLISALPILTILRQKQRGAASKAQLIEGVNDEVALLAALGGILFVARGFPLADPIASIVVALVIAFNAVMLWRENAALLMGASPGADFYDRIRAIAFGIPGVLEVHNMIAEQVGEQIHLGMHIEVSRGIPIEDADAIADGVHDAICASFDDIWVVVHPDPEQRGTAGSGTGKTPSSDCSPQL
ncbi:MAG TPA: cation diffusion facilitator family transporter [Coriobacteriia bacterium]